MAIFYREVFTKKEFTKAEKELDNVFKDLVLHARGFCKDNFGITLKIPIKFNGRLKSTMGRYTPPEYEVEMIELSKGLVVASILAEDMSAVYDTLNHELVHYSLRSLGMPYHDGDQEFEEALQDLGISASGTTKKEKILSDHLLIAYSWQPAFKCPNCHELVRGGRGTRTKSSIIGTCAKCDKKGMFDKQTSIIVIGEKFQIV